jgi:segregation and condensation protein B
MSLKTKLEAVIYAAEEPVTLAQLTALFAEEALEWKAEQEAAAAEKATGEAENGPEGGTYLDLEFGEGEEQGRAGGKAEIDGAEVRVAASEGQNDSGESKAELKSRPANEEAQAEGGTISREPRDVDAAGSAEDLGEPAALAEANAEAEAKRAAKAREREARGAIRQVLDELISDYAADGRGIEIREIAGGFRMATKPECHDAVRSFVKSQKPPLKLSLPALETLAVIAYKQPVTVPEVNEIRGVDSSGVFGSLLARKLISTAGRKQVIGRPILYKTTREFLLRFGLKDVSELPSMEEFEKMAASELDELELAGGEGPAAQTEEEFSPDMSMEENGTAGEQGNGEAGTAPEAESSKAAETESASGSSEIEQSEGSGSV